MKLLKNIISYFFEIPIEKRQSTFSGTIEVALHKGQYKLSTNNAIYSFGTKYTSFDLAFKAINLQKYTFKNVLILGVGLGSVIQLLEKYSKVQSITAVDIDSEIIDLAKKYLPTSINDIKYICEDAFTYLENHTDKYDLILADIFIDDKTPMQFMQTDFLNALNKTLNKNGWLLYSKINDSNFNKIENEQFEIKFSAVFNDSFSVDTNGNKMYVYCNR